jgi:type II secretory pathway pseudopilin PulG
MFRQIGARMAILAMVTLLAGCNFPGSPLRAEGQTATSAAITLQARATEAARLTAPPVVTVPAPTSLPTLITPAVSDTPTPSATPRPSPTITPVPCNKAEFVKDVNYPDDTEVEIGTTFTKTWRLKNVGTCSWTTDYDLVFDRGDRMDAPSAQQLSASAIDPSETFDVSVQLTAPDQPDTYRADFKLRSGDGVLFGVGTSGLASFWVQIEAVQLTLPDLRIASLGLQPPTPTLGEPVEVTVVIRNRGEGDAGEFSVGWWPDVDGDAACTWLVESLEAGSEVTKTCTYQGYPESHPSLTTLAKADVGGAVKETNENNNSTSLSIEVLAP